MARKVEPIPESRVVKTWQHSSVTRREVVVSEDKATLYFVVQVSSGEERFYIASVRGITDGMTDNEIVLKVLRSYEEDVRSQWQWTRAAIQEAKDDDAIRLSNADKENEGGVSQEPTGSTGTAEDNIAS